MSDLLSTVFDTFHVYVLDAGAALRIPGDPTELDEAQARAALWTREDQGAETLLVPAELQPVLSRTVPTDTLHRVLRWTECLLRGEAAATPQALHDHNGAPVVAARLRRLRDRTPVLLAHEQVCAYLDDVLPDGADYEAELDGSCTRVRVTGLPPRYYRDGVFRWSLVKGDGTVRRGSAKEVTVGYFNMLKYLSVKGR